MIINGIDTKDISFVVQGAVDKDVTPKCLESIRKNFPGSEIILSTWKGTDVSKLDFDVLVSSADPGAAICDFHSILNNINRQIVSTVEGLHKVTRKYAAKVRSDLIFDGPDFLRYFERYTAFNENYRRVKARMIALTLYTRNFYINYDHYNVIHATYHVSDWFIFGYTEDVVKYFSVNKIDDLPSFSRYYLDKPEMHQLLPYPHLMSKLTPEQYFGAGFFENKNDYTVVELSNKDYNEHLRYLVNNFVILDYEYSHIYSGKWADRSRNEWIMHPFEVASLVFYADFLKYYKRFCDPSLKIENDIDKKVLKRKLKVLLEVLLTLKIKNYVQSKLEQVKRHLGFVKTFMKGILPSYRAIDATGNRLMALEADERERFNYLVYRLNELDKAQIENRKELRRIKTNADTKGRERQKNR